MTLPLISADNTSFSESEAPSGTAVPFEPPKTSRKSPPSTLRVTFPLERIKYAYGIFILSDFFSRLDSRGGPMDSRT